MELQSKNRGQAALERLVPKHGDRKKLSESLTLAARGGQKVAPNQITQWLAGVLPSGPNRTLMERELRIPSWYWDEPATDSEASPGPEAA